MAAAGSGGDYLAGHGLAAPDRYEGGMATQLPTVGDILRDWRGRRR